MFLECQRQKLSLARLYIKIVANFNVACMLTANLFSNSSAILISLNAQPSQ